MIQKHHLIFSLVFLATLLVGAVQEAVGRPEYHLLFLEDPLRRAGVEGCAVCHENPNGGGPRNEFGVPFENAGYVITPLMRSNFPGRFDVETAQLADGTTLHFSDPQSRSIVVEREGEKFVIDLLAAATGGSATLSAGQPPDPQNTLSFFVTSVGVGDGANLRGLAGADQHCQSLATSVGAGDRTWRAYLSTSLDGEPALNAGDRIGPGPWYNAKRVMVARGVSDLHSADNRLTKETVLTETGEILNGRGDQPNRHDILTGSLADGTAAPGMTCNNWTSSGEGSALVGHHDREGGGDSGSSWNSAHATRGCSQDDLVATGGDGLFYCFAVD